MNPETNASLQALEKELERLRSAVEHIEKAKTVAQKVVGAVAQIQKKYAEHLDSLLASQTEAAERIGDGTQERFEEISNSARRHILESAARAKKYLEDYNAQASHVFEAAGETAGEQVVQIAQRAAEIVQQAGEQFEQLTDRTGAMVDDAAGSIKDKIGNAGSKIERDVQDFVGKLQEQINELNAAAIRAVQHAGNLASQKVAEVGSKTSTAIEQLDGRAKEHVDEMGAIARSNIQEVLRHAKTSLDDAGNQSKKIFAAIKKTQDQQTSEFEKVTVSTDALIAASGKIVRAIDAIDFPSRLQAIERDIQSLRSDMSSMTSRLDTLEHSTKTSVSKMSEDIVGKIGRVEMFTEKTVRTLSDDVEKKFTQQQKDISGTRTLIILVLLVNILIAVGLFMLWNRDPEPMPEWKTVPVMVDTTAVGNGDGDI